MTASCNGTHLGRKKENCRTTAHRHVISISRANEMAPSPSSAHGPPASGPSPAPAAPAAHRKQSLFKIDTRGRPLPDARTSQEDLLADPLAGISASVLSPTSINVSTGGPTALAALSPSTAAAHAARKPSLRPPGSTTTRSATAKPGTAGTPALPMALVQLPPEILQDPDIAAFGGDAANGIDDGGSRSRAGKRKTPAHGKKIGSGLGGHPVVKQLLGTAPKAAAAPPAPAPAAIVAAGGVGTGGVAGVVGQAPPEVKIEDLDEAQLTRRLEALDKELAEYKRKCAYYKVENEWYRNEIATTQKDSTEYIEYLKFNEDQKKLTINDLTEARKKDMELFAQKKKNKEAENFQKMERMKAIIQDLEIKLEAKQQEMMNMSDVIAKRGKHEAEMSKIRSELEEADAIHMQHVTDLERTLLETRIKLQREADAKISEMESAAQEKAALYLADHTVALDQENRRLERELRECIMTTQRLLARKDALEKENRELGLASKVRNDLVKMRVEQVSEAQKRERARRRRMVADGMAERVRRALAGKAKLEAKLAKEASDADADAAAAAATAASATASASPKVESGQADVAGGLRSAGASRSLPPSGPLSPVKPSTAAGATSSRGPPPPQTGSSLKSPSATATPASGTSATKPPTAQAAAAETAPTMSKPSSRGEKVRAVSTTPYDAVPSKKEERDAATRRAKSTASAATGSVGGPGSLTGRSSPAKSQFTGGRGGTPGNDAQTKTPATTASMRKALSTSGSSLESASSDDVSGAITFDTALLLNQMEWDEDDDDEYLI
ncbi:hypothetical protein DFJ73DRAFT_961469 [Zopfochytrium polystomum]|nr:hypothetical protein DFJ73DRAFT_961469 [Zopfochytrium polystomum]